MSPKNALKILNHFRKFWWMYGVIVAGGLILISYLMEKNMTPKTVIRDLCVGFLIGGVILGWNAKNQIREIERNQKQNQENNNIKN